MANHENNLFYLLPTLSFITAQFWFITTQMGSDNPIFRHCVKFHSQTLSLYLPYCKNNRFCIALYIHTEVIITSPFYSKKELVLLPYRVQQLLLVNKVDKKTNQNLFKRRKLSLSRYIIIYYTLLTAKCCVFLATSWGEGSGHF